MACLTNEEIQNIIGSISCNNFDPLVDLVEEINERACAGCLGIVPAGTATTDFLTIAIAPEGGLAFDPVNPDCEEIWVREEDTDNRYVSLDDGLTWCQVCNGFCFNPETIPANTALQDILDEGWGDGTAGSGLLAIPDSANCSVLVALMGCEICFAVNDSVSCDLGDGTAGTGTDWHCLGGNGDALFTWDAQNISETPSFNTFNHTLKSNPEGFVTNPALGGVDDEFTLIAGTYQWRYDGSGLYSGGVPTIPVDNGGIEVEVWFQNITDTVTEDTFTFHFYAVSDGESVPSGMFQSGQFTITASKRFRLQASFTKSSANLSDPLIPEAFGNLRITKIG